MGDFKLCLIATEQVLDELVSVPRRVVEQPDCVAHLYVVLEVLEEPEQVVVRGFLRYDELVDRANQITASAECCVLPLSAFDAEIDHLIIYVQYLDPSAIKLSTAATQPQVLSPQVEVSSPPTIGDIRTRLSQWLQGVLDEGWQTIETLIDPEMTLDWNTRHRFLGTKGGKLINLGMQLGEQTVVLLVTVTPENEGKIGVNIQVLPAAGAEVLPTQLKLTLLSKMGKILQEVQSRAQDNYIQLKPFKGKPGAGFSVEVSCNDICVREAFEL